MKTSAAQASIRKSTQLFAMAATAAAALTALLAWSRIGMVLVPLLALVVFGLVGLALAGRLTAERQRRVDVGEPDLYLARNVARSEQAIIDGQVLAWRPLRRWIGWHVFGHPLLVGDTVRIKAAASIRATLDDQQSLQGLPFMKEMEKFCGSTARVYRVADKIYDYRRSRLMRRLDDCVLLVGLRCDGAAHGQCEAACYLIWKTQWLDIVPTTDFQDRPDATSVQHSIADPAASDYRCQYTQLSAASQPQAAFSLHGWLGPLVVGNVHVHAFMTAALTRAFNAFQAWRGGVPYPWMPVGEADRSLVGETLAPGDWVRVKTSAEIARSLDKNAKNRGLWFDADMLKFCGQTFQVRGRVHQIVDTLTLSMIPMKTPCIVLETVHYTGEFQVFGEQHDYLYWREAWLQKIAAPAAEA